MNLIFAYSTLILALIAVESSGNDSAIGDGGLAIGALQIHPILVHDVNRILRTNKYTLDDRWCRQKSIMMFHTYINHYATERRLGHPATNEDIARIWNGGPNGYKKSSTISYWKKVELELQKN